MPLRLRTPLSNYYRETVRNRSCKKLLRSRSYSLSTNPKLSRTFPPKRTC